MKKLTVYVQEVHTAKVEVEVEDNEGATEARAKAEALYGEDGFIEDFDLGYSHTVDTHLWPVGE